MDFKPIEKFKIKRIKNNSKKELNDSIIKEQPFTIFVNGYELVTLMTLPKDLKELTVGFLASEGILESLKEIVNIKFSHRNTIIQVELNKEIDINLFKKRTLTSGCGKGITFSNLKDCSTAEIIENNLTIQSDHVVKLMVKMQKRAKLFDETGGTHTSALASNDNIFYVIEDIGRHNTIDKIIGKSYLDKVDLNDKAILTSGRVSSEIIIKVLKQKIPILISRSAPTTAAVEIAREKKLTLIGFTRGNRFNIYSDLNRIKY
ncbi:MAG: formate dehydrogenase accessory sulfurtransferase FdhD [Halanaerobiales bacterium]